MDQPLSARCGKCGEPVPEDHSPCPSCGATTRNLTRTVNDELTLRSSLGLIATHGSGEVFHEQYVGDSLSADGVWVREEWVRDKDVDLERHKVVFPDGRPDHRHEGRLTEKRGHGSDKPELRAQREELARRKQEAHFARKLLNDRARTEFVAGAEEEWRRRTGRPMTAEEMERVLRRYPGDV